MMDGNSMGKTSTERSSLITKGMFVPGARLRMNVIPMIFNTLLPWSVFVAVSFLITFRFHHDYPWFAYIFVVACYFPAVYFGYLAYNAWKRRDPVPQWYRFACLACVLSHSVAFILGEINYESNLLPYYQTKDMKAYPHLDASSERGQNTMDAGRINFADGNHVDISRSWHFTHKQVYCVAPIVGATVPKSGSYDYWAVGINCCAMSSSDFRCGDANKANARSALRSLDFASTPFYRLAVQQAETVHGIFSAHPLFFTWTADPLFVLDTMRESGFSMFLMSCCMYFVFSLLCSVLAAYKFAWIGRIKDAKPM
eukprot:GEMP01073122.1.p1 GENE.GEMP01073122.1~~GEMP01073122.1.p1  ORF type:complete len:312 (+),score=52.06 GEMP01073122.1:196-1131(+)